MLPELIDQPVDTEWGAPSTWDLLAIRRMLLRMLQLKRLREQLDALRKRINEQYLEQIGAHDAEYEALRANVQVFITEHNGGENVKLPDVGTAFIQNKNAQPRMVLASQEAAVSLVAGLPDGAPLRAASYKQVFDPQGYLQAQQETVEGVLRGAAVDDAGRVRLTDDGTGVVQTTGEIVQLPPGVQLQVPKPVLALRPA